MRRAALAGAAALAAAGALALDGAQAVGRLALRLDAPALALPLLRDPALAGLALHARGDWAAAAEAFRRAGPTETYNRADALARRGDYAASLAAYDAVLSRAPDDLQAVENRRIVAGLFDPIKGDILPGDDAAGDGSGPDDAISPFDAAVSADGGAQQLYDQPRADLAPTTAQSRAEQVRRTPEAQARVADRRWLATFRDEPGVYLKAIIAAERDRRARAGLAPPDPVDPR